MEYSDLEGGIHRGTLSLRRKWHKVPRFLRFYLAIALVFVITLFFSYFHIYKINNTKIDDSLNVDLHTIDYHNALPKSEKFEDVLQKTQFTISNVIPEQLNRSNSPFLTANQFKVASLKQNGILKRIREAIQHSWKGYYKFAIGYDHLKPLTKTGNNWFKIGLTVLDSLDTLLMAGLDDEYNQAIEWIKNDLTFDVNQDVNCFETTIRALAGLLSAYHLTQDKLLLEKATDLGDRLIHCFDSPSRTVPFSDVNLKTKNPKGPIWSPDSTLSEVSSVQMEFRDLSKETNNILYEKKSFATSEHIHELVKIRNDPLLPMFINPISGNLSPGTITLGARADSYYEYLYKQYLQTNIGFLYEDYLDAINKIKQRLVGTTKGNLKLVYIGEISRSQSNREIYPKMDHLVCFLSGTLALGYYHESLRKVQTYRGHVISSDNKTFSEHLKLAEDLARTCHYMYNLTETGLSPEIAYFGTSESDKEFMIRPADAHNLLRPEFVESLFFLYHITSKQVYRDWGLQVFLAFQKYTRVSTGGYTSIGDVRNPKNVKPKDKMESFWLAETLKYLYLLFLDDKEIISKLLNNYIFNTEGHLLLRRV